MSQKKKALKILSLIVVFAMICGIIGDYPIKVLAGGNSSINLVANGDFENGTLDEWTKHGDPTLEVTTEQAIGNYSMKVAGRTNSYEGPAYSFLGKMENGATYNVSLKVRVVDGQIAAGHQDPKITVTMRRVYTPSVEGDTGSYYDTIVWQKPVSEDAWTTLTGSYTLTYNGTLKELFMYIESPDPTLEYYIDDVIVTPVNTPQVGNIIENGTFESGDTTGWVGTGQAVISAVKEEAHSGNYSLETAGRTADWMGPSYNLTGKIVPGKQYSVDFWVKYNNGNDTEQFKATVKATPTTGSPQYIQVNNPVSVKKGEWAEIKGSFTVPDGDYSSISIYVETPGSTIDFYIDDFEVIGEIAAAPIKIQKDIPDFYSVFLDCFPIGVAVEPGRLVNTDPHSQLTAKHFNMLVAENAMKPESLQPQEGIFTFSNADKIVDFAIAHNMKMRGHTLLWHNQVPDWFFQDPSDPTKTAPRELLLERLKTHIFTVLGHFKEKYGSNNPIIAWDVVNEVLDDNGQLRNSKWLQIIGPDYIEKAFEYAHEADPNVKLFINDYNIENNGAKTQAMYELVKSLKEKGVPIDGIGMQMHININSNVESIKASIEKFKSLGVEIHITELDMNMLGDVSQDALLKQARLYKQIFDLLKQEKDHITAVVFWGVSDDVTWLKQPNAPLLFDTKLQAKPAYWAIVDPSKVAVDRQVISVSQGSPVIGTNIDKIWSTEKWFYANNFVKNLNGATAKFKLLWDAKNLYVLVQVDDTTPSKNDSIEIFVDKNQGSMSQTEIKHYTIRRDNSGNTDILNYVQEETNGYVVQMAIPIDDLNPQIGTKIGFDIKVNDDKGGGQIDTIAVWNDYSNSGKTEYYGLLLLSKTSQITEAVYGTPIIDGKIDDIWDKANTIYTNVWVQGTSGPTAKARTMWDENYLYVLAEVTGAKLNKSSPNPWEQDSVEFFVDENNYKSPYYQSGIGQYRVNFDNEQSFGDSTNSEGFKSATSITSSSSYIVEVAIPFKTIKPTDGHILGFDVQVNGADESGNRTSIVLWNDPSGNSWKDASGFGNLILVDTRLILPTPRPQPAPTPTEPTEASHEVSQGKVVVENNTTIMVVDETKISKDIKDTLKKEMQFDLTNIGKTDAKALEIPVSVINLVVANNKNITIKLNDVTLKFDPNSLVVSKNTIDLINQVGAVRLTIQEKGRQTPPPLTPVSNAYDVKIKAGDKEIKVDSPVKVTFEIKDAKDIRKVGVYYLNETTGKWEYVGGKIDKKTNTVTAEVIHFSTYGAFEYDKQFKDVSKDFWAYDGVNVLASRHIIRGVDDDTFAPNAKITRAEFAAFMIRALGIPEEPYKGEFEDVKEGAWYANAIEAAYRAGIMLGDGKNMRPKAPITREEMTAVIMRVYSKLTGYKEENIGNTTFTDNGKISEWARNAVANVMKLGIVRGYEDNTFKPKDNATRAEAAAMLYRVLEISSTI
ncbi:endo-1,4-beta-xylanase [Thermoanaerobacter mathranii]|uniref:endo-1,4-beta-xylanase n=1 Tax=Thermoanaerobacter mathranii TaxID=583357 RepID=UPI003AAE4682